MKVMTFELSTGRGSLAWASAETQLKKEWPNDRKNSASFFENLKLVSESYGFPATIIVGLGPGSYAGVRIAISAALGLSAAAQAQLIGFPSVCASNAATRIRRHRRCPATIVLLRACSP
jgi:tRNA A37 threonylcarbamoyladenosine modification protein TsaB